MSESKTKQRNKELKRQQWIESQPYGGRLVRASSLGLDAAVLIFYMYWIGAFDARASIDATEVSYMLGYVLAMIAHAFALMVIDAELWLRLGAYEADAGLYNQIDDLHMSALVYYMTTLVGIVTTFVITSTFGYSVVGTVLLGSSTGTARYAVDILALIVLSSLRR